MKEVTPTELKRMTDSHEDFQFIDVREPYEVEEDNIGGINIPMGDVIARVSEISKDKKAVIYCRSGRRSGVIIQTLEQQFAYTNLFNLKGGIIAYHEEVKER